MNKELNIGIDVDGVLRNLGEYQLRKGKKYFKDSLEIDESKLEIKDIFGCTEEEEKKFWEKYIWEYSLKEPMYKDAADIIKLLQSKGCKVHIITQYANTLRDDFLGKLFRGMLERFLRINGVKPDSINYCSEFGQENDKLNTCKRLNIDYMVEDNPQNIEKLSECCRVIGINTKYNSDVQENDNILKVDSFSQVYDAITQYEKQKKGLEYMKTKFFKDDFTRNYKLMRGLGVPVFKRLLKPKIINAEVIPEDGPIVLCGNHLHVWDQFPVICATDRVTHWMSKKEYFDSKLGYFFRKTGAISVDRQGDASESVNTALNYLNIGSAIGIFPEGTRNGLKTSDIERLYQYGIDIDLEQFKGKIRENNPLLSHIKLLEELYENKVLSKEEFLDSLFNARDYLTNFSKEGIITAEQLSDAELLPFKFGAVSMASKTNATIVPFGVTGDYKIGNDNLTVSFGEPFKVSEGNLEGANKELRQKILNLVKNNRNL